MIDLLMDTPVPQAPHDVLARARALLAAGLASTAGASSTLEQEIRAIAAALAGTVPAAAVTGAERRVLCDPDHATPEDLATVTHGLEGAAVLLWALGRLEDLHRLGDAPSLASLVTAAGASTATTLRAAPELDAARRAATAWTVTLRSQLNVTGGEGEGTGLLCIANERLRALRWIAADTDPAALGAGAAWDATNLAT
jgi:hypothetical protein